MSLKSIHRHWDIVFCLDCTGTMAPAWDTVKRQVTMLCPNLQTLYRDEFNAGAPDIALRIKVIIFRDYSFDECPMEESRFFTMPEDADALKEFLDGQEPTGGGDPAENGFEALYYALMSDFDIADINHTHQTIALITDADAHSFEECALCPNYPNDIPSALMQGFGELPILWREYCSDFPDDTWGFKWCKNRRRHLFFFAPAGTRYERLSEDIEHTRFHPLDPAKGAEELNDISPEEFAKTLIYDTFFRMD